jgi:hypothetical protein
MNSLHQNINREPVDEQKSAVEGIHSRWSSSSQVIVDSHHRNRSVAINLDEEAPLKDSKGAIRSGLTVMGSSTTVYSRNKSVADEAQSGNSSRVLRDGARVLKPPLTQHRLRRSFAIE